MSENSGGPRIKGGRECIAASVAIERGLDTVDSVDTSSVKDIDSSGKLEASGSEGSQPSKSGSGTTRGRRTVRVTKETALPPSTPSPPSLEVIKEQVERFLSGDEGQKEMLAQIKRDLLTNYMIEVRAGQDQEINAQHSRASRKQAKEVAELLIQLTKSG